MARTLPDVVDLLQENGPLLSSDVSRKYREMGLSDSAARQRTNRRSDEVKQLYGLPFPRGARFLYLEGEFGDARFYSALIVRLQETGSAYGAALSGLFARNGICLAKDWPIVSSAPEKQKGHLSHGRILDGLKQAKLVQEVDITGIGLCLALSDRIVSWNSAHFRARLTIEHVLRAAVRDWAIRLGWSSKGAIQTAEDDTLPKFSTMNFDLVGPCYLNALITRSKGTVKPGFFVCDVVFSGTLQVEHVAGFVKKIGNLKALRNLGRFQPMILADAFTEDALMVLRAQGIVAATPESLFGRQVAAALAELLRVLQKSAEIAIGNPEKIEELFDQLSGLEGNLRGALFEMIVGHLVRMTQSGSIDVGVLVTDFETRSKADIDVRNVSETELVCYECKGHGPDVRVTLEEVKYWLEKQVPIMRAAHNNEQRFHNLTERFEFWTTGQFDPEVIAYLEDRQKNIRKYQIAWQGPDEVLTVAAKLKNKTMHRLLKRFYRKDPLA